MISIMFYLFCPSPISAVCILEFGCFILCFDYALTTLSCLGFQDHEDVAKLLTLGNQLRAPHHCMWAFSAHGHDVQLTNLFHLVRFNGENRKHCELRCEDIRTNSVPQSLVFDSFERGTLVHCGTPGIKQRPLLPMHFRRRKCDSSLSGFRTTARCICGQYFCHLHCFSRSGIVSPMSCA